MKEVDPNGIAQHAPGAKLDDGKPDCSLLVDFGRALQEVALVGTLGAHKYSRGGWQSVPDGIVRYTAAMLRHLFKEKKSTYDTDPYYDTDQGLAYKGRIRHDAQVAWNALARLELTLREEENVERKQADLAAIASLGQASAKPGSVISVERGGITSFAETHRPVGDILKPAEPRRVVDRVPPGFDGRGGGA